MRRRYMSPGRPNTVVVRVRPLRPPSLAVHTLQEVLADFAEYIGTGPTEVAVSTRSSAGQPPLHWMATLGDAPAIRLLVAGGAEVSAPDQQGNTPLHEAVSRRHVPAAQELIVRGAHLHLRNASGRTPEDIVRADGHPPMLALFATS